METTIRQQLKEQIAERYGQEDSVAGTAPGLFIRASRVEVSCFFRSFSILVAAEYPLARALTMLSNSTSNADLAQTVRAISGRVEAGESMSRVMAAYPWYFDRITCATVRAAEETAQLARALDFIAESVEAEVEIRERASQALTYPGLVLAMSVVVVTGVLYFVVPMFAQYMEDGGMSVNGFAAFIYALSDAIRNPVVPLLIIGAVVAGGVAFRGWRRRNPVGFYRSMSRLPVLGSILLQAALARFVSVFRMLVVNEVPIPRALELSGASVENAHLRRVIGAMQGTIEQGRTMADVLRREKGLPTVFVDMMSLAEETGRLDDILGHLARALQAELGRRVSRLSGVAEPVMLIILGVVVLTIMLSFFAPYIEMIGSIGTAG